MFSVYWVIIFHFFRVLKDSGKVVFRIFGFFPRYFDLLIGFLPFPPNFSLFTKWKFPLPKFQLNCMTFTVIYFDQSEEDDFREKRKKKDLEKSTGYWTFIRVFSFKFFILRVHLIFPFELVIPYIILLGGNLFHRPSEEPKNEFPLIII